MLHIQYHKYRCAGDTNIFGIDLILPEYFGFSAMAWSLMVQVMTLIPAWISNHQPGKMCDEITYSFLNFNGRNG